MRTNKKVREGVVLSNKMNKTVIVAVERRALNGVFKKIVKHVKRFKAHDEKNECRAGDRVQLIETRPISREKCWRVRKILARAALVEGEIIS